MTPESLVGAVFGRLTITSVDGKHGKNYRVNCRCACGKIKSIRLDHIRAGKTTSCGCYWQERRIAANTTHGMTGSRIYRIWRDMINRCHYEKYPERHLYGGRGIVVCDRWRESFQSFMDDMGVPDDNLSIDRIDVNGNYEPGNCRWATAKEQAANTRARSSELGVTFYDLPERER